MSLVKAHGHRTGRTHGRDSHLRAWQHGSDEILSRRANGAAVSKNRYLGLRHGLIASIVQPQGQELSTLLDPSRGTDPQPTSYQRLSHRSGSQGHWPSHVVPTNSQARNCDHLRSLCSIASVGPNRRPTTSDIYYIQTEPPAPPTRSRMHLPAFVLSCRAGTPLVVAAMYRRGWPRQAFSAGPGDKPVGWYSNAAAAVASASSADRETNSPEPCRDPQSPAVPFPAACYTTVVQTRPPVRALLHRQLSCSFCFILVLRPFSHGRLGVVGSHKSILNDRSCF
jgi:hypothetical protein